MAVLKEIEWRDPQVRQLQSQIVDAENSIRRSNERIENNLERIAKYRESFDRMNSFVMDVVHLDSFQGEMLTIVTDKVAEINDYVKHYEDKNREYYQIISRLHDNINTFREKLSRLGDGVTVFNKQVIKDAVSEVPSIVQRSICVGKDDSKGPFVRWRYTGLVLRPDINKFVNINFGKDIEIPLGDLTCSFFLNNNSITVVPIRGGKRFRAYDGNLVAHPHILSGHHPCLGDFAGPLTEALDEKDFGTVAVLMEAFLSQAASEDAAGRHWYKWLHGLIDCNNFSENHSRHLDGRIVGSYHSVANEDRSSFTLVENAYVINNGQSEVYQYSSDSEYYELRSNYNA